MGVAWVSLIVLLPAAVAVLLVIRITDWYDRLSSYSHSQVIRRLIPWRWSRPMALLPLATLIPGLTNADGFMQQLGWLVAGLVLAEVYSVGFHRESYIAAFEPWWLPIQSAPLGRPPVRSADRRLQYLVRTQVIYAIPLLIPSVLIRPDDPLVAWVILFCFVAKYIVPAWVDYEAYFHWDMHCRVLEMSNAPRISKAWRMTCEYGLGPLVGSVPRLYSTEHLVIHHPSNAGPRDIHSPLPFSRLSFIEFCFYAWKTVAILATGWGVFQHRRCSPRQRFQVLSGVMLVWVLMGLGIWVGAPLALWLLAALIYRGFNTAIAQYVWHGLHDGSGSGNPLSTTILWLPRVLPTSSQSEPVHPTDSLLEVLPYPGADWAFFDNYHLVHHLHPRAHFQEYPRLLERDLPKAIAHGSPVLYLEEYGLFFDDLMARRLDRIALSVHGDQTHAEKVRELGERLAPFPEVRTQVSKVSESRVGITFDEAFRWSWEKLTR